MSEELAARVLLDGANERARLLLQSKHLWMARALAAEADLQALRAAVAALIPPDGEPPSGEPECHCPWCGRSWAQPHAPTCRWAALRAQLPLDVQRADGGMDQR